MTGEEYQKLVMKNQDVIRNPRYGNTGYGVSCLRIQNPIDDCLKVWKDSFISFVMEWCRTYNFGPIFTE